ncbi:glycoside hydrolase 43 family protein [Cohnella ginsengisoli]|uniref:Glycoside hydrolase 43 family protein n=1 Tax=Cohnella ginsengisoli TaxID=425004 RepID=A0A9X4KHI2_9BACL|nr:glycoside hydrolase 43 family protein [Cohnella ginsengisoli]MDG0792282.1 glycoside hydrolase 43 family protein [Cohnella ginsengisoli]
MAQHPWVPDQGDGTYLNPIVHADYSDPDVIRVGSDFYMTASSFGHLPGLPILHSRDLVNWRLINHAVSRMPLAGYDVPQHGGGVWAPSLRYHAGKYWIYYGDPDLGILMTTADDPAGAWAPLHLVKPGKGLIDVCPLWDDDGRAYLIHAYAHSRSGIKHKLNVCEMSADGRTLLDEGRIVYDGTDKHPTLEGPKFYKRDGYYYIFAPAGGVATGWQTVFRSASVWGPYEDRIVLHQGETEVNGPHQGGWVELASGESWFVHFQDKGPYGRVVHLQPMSWDEDGWPVMGERRAGEAIGEPVLRWRKPDVGEACAVEVPATSDEFDAPKLGLQWQWQANPDVRWYSLSARPGFIRLHAVPRAGEGGGLYRSPNLLMQKFPAPAFAAECLVDATGLKGGDSGGLIVFGYRYSCLAVRRGSANAGDADHAEDDADRALTLYLAAGDKAGEAELWSLPLTGTEGIRLRVEVSADASCVYSYSLHDGASYAAIPAEAFQASEGHWVGAKLGLFASGSGGGQVEFDWFRVSARVDGQN